MSWGLPLMKTREREPSNEGHREVGSLRKQDVCHERKRHRGKAQRRLWGLDVYQVLPEPAETPRRDPFTALLGNPGLKVFPRPPDTESVQCQALSFLSPCEQRDPTQ